MIRPDDAAQSGNWLCPGPVLLFCPADRPDRFAKAAAAADTVILDLEDSVAPEHKQAARAALQQHQLDPARTVVRLNRAGTPEHALDLESLRHTAYRTVMLAKAESAVECEQLGKYTVIALCETALGIIRAFEIAGAGNVAALMWGAEDLILSLGGSGSRGVDGRYREVVRHARSSILLAAAAAGKAAIDAVHVDLADNDGLAIEAADAAASGFVGTACIHPMQAAVIRAAYRPTDPELHWAQAVLALAETESGVFAFEGRMVDAPVIGAARRLVARANSSVPR